LSSETTNFGLLGTLIERLTVLVNSSEHWMQACPSREEVRNWRDNLAALATLPDLAEMEHEITVLHNTCGQYEKEIVRLKALPPAPPQGQELADTQALLRESRQQFSMMQRGLLDRIAGLEAKLAASPPAQVPQEQGSGFKVHGEREMWVLEAYDDFSHEWRPTTRVSLNAESAEQFVESANQHRPGIKHRATHYVAASPPAPAQEPHGWQPIATCPRDRLVWFWLIPKTAEETYHDTSGKPILADFEAYACRIKYGQWSSLCKARCWHEDTEPLPPSP